MYFKKIEKMSYYLFEANDGICRGAPISMPIDDMHPIKEQFKVPYFEDKANYGEYVAIINALTYYIDDKHLGDYDGYRMLSFIDHDDRCTSECPITLGYVILFEKKGTPTIIIYTGEAYIVNENGKTIENVSVYHGCPECTKYE